MKQDLISIIVPVYKVEKYIGRCVESLLNQTYKNIEIILVDDGSPDNCGYICEEYAILDERVRVYHQKNQGLSSARNTGLCNMMGIYVTFVDSDDYVAIDYIEKLYDSLKKNDADIAICAEEYVLENNNMELEILNRPFNEYEGDKIMTNEEALSCSLRQDLYDASAWAKLYKSKLFENVRFPVGYAYEDQGTTYKTFLKSRQIVYHGEHLYFYLQRSGSILHTNANSKRYWDGIKMVEKQCNEILLNYPKLVASCNSRLFSIYCHAIYGGLLTNDNSIIEYSWIRIKDLRKKVLVDDKARRKARYAALLSYLGSKIFKMILKTR